MKNFIDYYLLVAESNNLVTHHDSSSRPFTVQYKTIGKKAELNANSSSTNSTKSDTIYWVNFGDSNGKFPNNLWIDLTPLRSDTLISKGILKEVLKELRTPYSSIGGLRDVLGQITRRNKFYVVEVYFPTEDGNDSIPVRAFYGTEAHLKVWFEENT